MFLSQSRSLSLSLNSPKINNKKYLSLCEDFKKDGGGLYEMKVSTILIVPVEELSTVLLKPQCASKSPRDLVKK